MRSYCCKDCGGFICKLTALYGGGRCRPCSKIKTFNPNYIDGRTKNGAICVDCGKFLKSRLSKRCNSCARQGQLNTSFKDGLPHCLGCGKELTGYSYQRCVKCNKVGNLNPMFGKPPKHGKRINYNNVTFRSSWEANFAKWLDLSRIRWEYESKTFDLGNTTYTPDFYLPEFNCHIEIKGWWRDKSKQKTDLFLEQYSHINFKLFEKQDLLEYGII